MTLSPVIPSERSESRDPHLQRKVHILQRSSPERSRLARDDSELLRMSKKADEGGALATIVLRMRHGSGRTRTTRGPLAPLPLEAEGEHAAGAIRLARHRALRHLVRL